MLIHLMKQVINVVGEILTFSEFDLHVGILKLGKYIFKMLIITGYVRRHNHYIIKIYQDILANHIPKDVCYEAMSTIQKLCKQIDNERLV